MNNREGYAYDNYYTKYEQSEGWFYHLAKRTGNFDESYKVYISIFSLDKYKYWDVITYNDRSASSSQR